MGKVELWGGIVDWPFFFRVAAAEETVGSIRPYTGRIFLYIACPKPQNVGGLDFD